MTPTPKPGADPFAMLGVRAAYDVDAEALEQTHRDLSRALHPDRYLGAAPSERRAALDRAIAVNEAYRTLRDPIRRAEALLALSGLPVGEEHEPKADPGFLMEMLELREALAEAKQTKDRAELSRMADGARRRSADIERELARGFAAGDLSGLVGRLGQLRYTRRLQDEIRVIEDELPGP